MGVRIDEYMGGWNGRMDRQACVCTVVGYLSGQVNENIEAMRILMNVRKRTESRGTHSVCICSCWFPSHRTSSGDSVKVWGVWIIGMEL